MPYVPSQSKPGFPKLRPAGQIRPLNLSIRLVATYRSKSQIFTEHINILMPCNSVLYYTSIYYIRPTHSFLCSHVALSLKSLGTPDLRNQFCKYIYRGLTRNKLITSEGSRMRSTGPNEIKFELQTIQMIGHTFIK